jgi:hypothetical protein
LGVYIGLIIEQRCMSSAAYPYFYDTSYGITFLRILVTTIIGCPIYLIRTEVRDSYDLYFRSILTPLFFHIYLFGFSKWVSLKFGLVNKRTLSEDDDLLFYV